MLVVCSESEGSLMLGLPYSTNHGVYIFVNDKEFEPLHLLED